jgi:hypothetical protein
MMQKNNSADSGHDHNAPVSSKLPAGNSANQLRATTVAKDARIKEAGLGGNRTGKSSASGKLAQAHRDAVNDTIPETPETTHASPDAQPPEEHPIQVQVNTDHNIHGGEKLNLYVQDTVNASLGRFGRQITRVEIHLSDDNGSKSNGDDMRCLLEARPAGHKPLVVTHVGATLDQAVDGAVDMMKKLLDRTFAKLHDPKGRTSLGEDPTV